MPAVRDRKLALADLERSRALWHEQNPASYSYVRALQASSEEVEFTLVVVRDSVVVERAFLASRSDLDGLGDRMAGKKGQAPRLLWRERGHEIGAHEAGAAALTMDQLYDSCRDRVLSVRSELVPRLSFHRSGLLQHCGFLTEDCADCPVYSVQSVGRTTPAPWQVPTDLLCTDRQGLFLDGESPVGAFPCELCRCDAHNRANPHPTPEPPPTAEQLQRCEETGEDCPPEQIGNICKIDPAACPPGDRLPNRADWTCVHLLTADGCTGFGYSPTPECMALPRPNSWSDPEWQRRCLPRHEP